MSQEESKGNTKSQKQIEERGENSKMSSLGPKTMSYEGLNKLGEAKSKLVNEDTPIKFKKRQSKDFESGKFLDIETENPDRQSKEGVKESKQDETPQTDDKSNQDQTISDYILENKMLLMKIGKLQSEVNKNGEKEKQTLPSQELEEKNALINKLQSEIEELKRENSELKESVKFQKYLVEEKVEIIKKEQQKVKDVQNSFKSQNAVIEQLKRMIAELEEQQQNESGKSGISESSLLKFDTKGLDEEQSIDKANLIENYRRLEKAYDEIKKEQQFLQETNKFLQETIQSEQDARVKQYKDSMELEIQLKVYEDELIKSQQDRYNLASDLDRLSTHQNELISKIKESEEIFNTCVAFLEKNGLIQSSFLSDDAVIFLND